MNGKCSLVMFEFETIEWMNELLGQVGKMLINMTMMVKKDKRNKRSNDTEMMSEQILKGNEVKKVKNMAVTVKDLSIKTWWRSLVTYR